MSEFCLFQTDEFLKRLDKLPSQEATQIRKKLKNYVYPQLRGEPFFGPNIKKLRDYSPDTWRYRIGPFRLFYSVDIDESVVYLLTIGYRRDAYRK